MLIFGMVLWSIFGGYGTYMIIKMIYGDNSKVGFSPEQIGGLVMLPMGGVVTLFLAYLIDFDIISIKWDK